MKRTILLIFSFICFLTLSAQGFFVTADVVSEYMWRGRKNGNAAIQPELGYTAGGLSISAWGSTELKDNNNEVDFILSYELNNFTLSIMDIYTQNEDVKSDFFHYSSHTTGHIIDLGLKYTISEKLPVALSWYTLVGGNDYKENNKRAWSTYCELSYPIYINDIYIELETGISPWEGIYADTFAVTNIAFKVSKSFRVTELYSLPVFGQLGINPNDKKVYFVFGLTF